MISLVESQQPFNITESALSAEAKSLLSSTNLLSINGTIFQDLNSNAKRDSEEIGLIGWTIKLSRNGSESIATRTDGFGHYAFNNLEPGVYSIAEELQTGWNQTGNETYLITLVDEDIHNIDFGNMLRREYISNTTTGMNLTPEQFQKEERILENLSEANISPTIKAKLMSAARDEGGEGQYFSLYNDLHSVATERDQGDCGNCWVWASTGVMEVDNSVHNGVSERHSIQYFDSKYSNGDGCGFVCCGGNPTYAANFYTNVLKKAIPWSNNNAEYADGDRCCSGSCPNGGSSCDSSKDHASTDAGSISEDHNYPINSVIVNSIPTSGIPREESISNIKNVLLQHKAVYFSLHQPSHLWLFSDFQDHWISKSEGDIWTPDVSSWLTTDVWGHGLLCVGFDDRDPSNPYWIMVNSWGTKTNRPHGIVLVSMNMDYSYQLDGSNAFNFITFDISWKDNFGYTLKDSNAQGGPTYDWIEISDDGTEVLPDSDDPYVSNIPLGFFFNYYGTDYSQLAISNNGLLFSGVGSTQFVNQPIKQSSAVHGFVAPFWDDLVTWGTAGSVYYKTLGIEPNRKFVVEWKDNQHYHDSTEGITFEAILYEGSNNIQFQYLDTNFGTVTGSTSSDLSPYDNGGSATIGIESPDGNDGLQYSYNEQVINPELAILYKFPQFAGTNLYLSKQAPASKDRGSTMEYTMHYHNFGDTAAQNVVLTDTLPNEVEYVSSSDGGSYDPGTKKVTWNIGSVAPNGHSYRTVTVRILQSAVIGTLIQNEASISTSNLEVRYDDNVAQAETSVTGSNLPPNVGVEPNLGGTTPSVYWTTPITFSYHDPTATSVAIRIHLDDGGPDITGSMINGPPDWTYTATFYPRHGHATVTYTVQGQAPITFSVYIDPAGYIYDILTNERIQGASVWLQRPDGTGGWENVPTGQTPAIMQPDENPLITGVDGQYQWDVLEGSYRVHVEAPGYYPMDSVVVSIPPPVTDLHVGLTRTMTRYVALRAANGQFFCAEGSGGGAVVVNRNVISGWETFKLIDLGNGNVALQAANGQYLCAEGGGGDGVVANRDWIGGWETFKLIDLGNNDVALQAYNGQYLCAEGSGGGAVVANRDGIGSWETFKLVSWSNVALQAYKGQYVCAEGGGGDGVVANRNWIGGWETFKLTDLSNNVVALQAANNQYLCAEGSGGGAVVANRNWILGWEMFKLIDLGNNEIALQATNGQYLCAEGGGGSGVVANRDWVGGWETFKLIPI
ncbi:SdrD B-like domain-containing protein [Methanothrix soehngenii]|jgi:uncharacterized repeat protein (TIGR01451 family)|uniref:DUF7910 domain-containing protein n=1 Tax=Methanothrix soehngenii TaxID=2223 RepID=UPI00300CACF5